MFTLPFMKKPVRTDFQQPLQTCYPSMESSRVAARYEGVRIGGDFFDMLTAGDRLLLLVLDISGRREFAFHIAAIVQQVFRNRAEELFSRTAVNESENLTELVLEINRTILEAAGAAHLTTAFVASYNQSLGTLFYISAGYPPALLRDAQGITQLATRNLPLGLFLHATHDTEMTVLSPGSTLLIYSRGILEAWADKDHLGMKLVRRFLQKTTATEPNQLCNELLATLKSDAGRVDNDLTAVCLMRSAIAQAAAR
jgi:serine phosphatase RsbU (regulator of sigma subunit)